MAETILPASLTQETQRRYLTYAMSVITSRALPDVRDGLKPVQRRILYTMYHDLHLTFDGRPRKCAKIVGDVTGNYHPHGTVPAYEALVRLAQDFVMRVPLVHGQGNFTAENARKLQTGLLAAREHPRGQKALKSLRVTGFETPSDEYSSALAAILKAYPPPGK